MPVVYHEPIITAIRLTNKPNNEPISLFIQLADSSKNIGICEKRREGLAPKKVNLPDEPNDIADEPQIKVHFLNGHAKLTTSHGPYPSLIQPFGDKDKGKSEIPYTSHFSLYLSLCRRQAVSIPYSAIRR
ncbi:MAG: hypothetical protein K8F52_10200 [Candidatus Scalindua rubra]|nr:hypothetical protein [Candidatus Scalindua rubra]